MAHKKLEKLKKWYQIENQQLIDYVLLLGDFDNLNQDKQKIILDACMKSQAEITDLVSYLQFFCTPIYLIPGNHDPHTMLYPQNIEFDRSDVTQYIKNIHRDCVNLRKDLQIVAFGGSVPGYQLKGD